MELQRDSKDEREREKLSNKIYAFNKNEIKRKIKVVAGKLLQINYTGNVRFGMSGPWTSVSMHVCYEATHEYVLTHFRIVDWNNATSLEANGFVCVFIFNRMHKCTRQQTLQNKKRDREKERERGDMEGDAWCGFVSRRFS